MPIDKINVQYGCERCASSGIGGFVEIKLFGKFRHIEDNTLVELFACPNCKAIYVKMLNQFVPGIFQDECPQVSQQQRY